MAGKKSLQGQGARSRAESLRGSLMDGYEVYGKTWIRSPATPWEFACRAWAFDVEEMAACPYCKNKRVRIGRILVRPPGDTRVRRRVMTNPRAHLDY